MNDQQDIQIAQSATIRLEVISENGQQSDIAYIDEIGRDIVDHLRRNGYIVKPTYTGRMGNPIFDINILDQVLQFIRDNKDLLISIFSFAASAFNCIKAMEDRKTKKEGEKDPLIVSLYVNGKDVSPDKMSSTKTVKQLQRGHVNKAQEGNSHIDVVIKIKVPEKRIFRQR